MNVCYLKDVNATISSEMRKLVAVRDIDCIKDDWIDIIFITTLMENL